MHFVLSLLAAGVAGTGAFPPGVADFAAVATRWDHGGSGVCAVEGHPFSSGTIAGVPEMPLPGLILTAFDWLRICTLRRFWDQRLGRSE